MNPIQVRIGPDGIHGRDSTLPGVGEAELAEQVMTEHEGWVWRLTGKRAPVFSVLLDPIMGGRWAACVELKGSLFVIKELESQRPWE
jgi:hypothetical protein